MYYSHQSITPLYYYVSHNRTNTPFQHLYTPCTHTGSKGGSSPHSEDTTLGIATRKERDGPGVVQHSTITTISVVVDTRPLCLPTLRGREKDKTLICIRVQGLGPLPLVAVVWIAILASLLRVASRVIVNLQIVVLFCPRTCKCPSTINNTSPKVSHPPTQHHIRT